MDSSDDSESKGGCFNWLKFSSVSLSVSSKSGSRGNQDSNVEETVDGKLTLTLSSKSECRDKQDWNVEETVGEKVDGEESAGVALALQCSTLNVN